MQTGSITTTGSGAGITAARPPRAPRTRAALQRALLLPLLDATVMPAVEVPDSLQRLRGPVVVVANHSSDLDCPLVLRALPGDLRRDLCVAAAADRFYRGRVRGAASELWLGTVPFDRTPGGGGVARCAALLRAGCSVLLFPEGTRSRDGRMGRFHTCAARLASNAGLAVVPVGIAGAFEAMPPGALLPRRARVTVRVGEPMLPEQGEQPRCFTARIEAAVGTLAAGATPPAPRA